MSRRGQPLRRLVLDPRHGSRLEQPVVRHTSYRALCTSLGYGVGVPTVPLWCPTATVSFNKTCAFTDLSFSQACGAAPSRT